MACVYMSCIMHKVSKYMYLNACFVLGNYKKFFNLDWSFNEKLLCVYGNLFCLNNKGSSLPRSND